MDLPGAVWEWPVLAALLVVVGWMLYQQKREREQVAEERARHEQRMERVVTTMEEERRASLEAWKGLMREGIQAQHQTAEALTGLCVEVEQLRRVTGEQFLEIAELLRQERRKREGRDAKAQTKAMDTGGD